MEKIGNIRNCWEIVHNSRYIAAFGSGISVFDRASLELVYHITGLRWVHGGLFADDDTLMVYTGEQKLFFFRISQKRLLWAVPRPREIATSGDMHCCKIRGTDEILCVAQGKKSLEEQFLLKIDYNGEKMFVRKLPDCYRVVTQLVWTLEQGVTFLSYQAKGDGWTLLYRIHQINGDACSILYEGESTQQPRFYSGNYLFLADCSVAPPRASAYPLTGRDHLNLGKPLPVILPAMWTSGPVGAKKQVLPRICWVDEVQGVLAACDQRDWAGVYDFQNGKMILEAHCAGATCAELLDGRLLIGTTAGLFAEQRNEME